jgi:acyl-CoA reductase-like NAD-dependent aldehyde dehydrogenase
MHAQAAARVNIYAVVDPATGETVKELAEIIVTEMGKPVGQARGEVDFCALIYAVLTGRGRPP